MKRLLIFSFLANKTLGCNAQQWFVCSGDEYYYTMRVCATQMLFCPCADFKIQCRSRFGKCQAGLLWVKSVCVCICVFVCESSAGATVKKKKLKKNNNNVERMGARYLV